MAAVLILEQGSNNRLEPEAIAELRNALGLAPPEPIGPDGIDPHQIPMTRVTRVAPAGLSDDDLVQLYRRAVLVGDGAATAHLAREALGRESIAERIPIDDLYQRLIALESSPDRALELIDEARERSRAAGTSTAPWDLAELELHIGAGFGRRGAGVAGAHRGRIRRRSADRAGRVPIVVRGGRGSRRSRRWRPTRPTKPPRRAPPARRPRAAASGRRTAIVPSGGKSSLWTPS